MKPLEIHEIGVPRGTGAKYIAMHGEPRDCGIPTCTGRPVLMAIIAAKDIDAGGFKMREAMVYITCHGHSGMLRNAIEGLSGGVQTVDIYLPPAEDDGEDFN